MTTTNPDSASDVEQERSGGKRLNNMPILILFGLGLAFLLMVALVMWGRGNRSGGDEQDLFGSKSSGWNDSGKIAAGLIEKYPNGVIAPAPPTLPSASPPPPQVGAQTPTPADTTPSMPPFPGMTLPPAIGDARQRIPRSYSTATPAVNEETQRIRQMKSQQFHQAVTAKTSVSGGGGGMASTSRGIAASTASSMGAASSRDEVLNHLAAVRAGLEQKRQTDPAAAYQQRMSALKASGLMPDSGMGAGMDGGISLLPDRPATVPNPQSAENPYAAFDNPEQGDRWQLDSRMQAPRSAFELRAGFVLPAVMISGINSDLPGSISAQVAHNVYDTATGRHLLIPQGTRLLGAYESDVMFGQSRVLIAWQRLIFPDGKALDLGSMPGADSAGYSGFKDQVNNHYVRLFGNAFLMSGVTAAVTLSQDRNSSSNNNNQRASDALSESMGQVFGNAIAQLISKNLNIAPTLEVRPGYRFNVIVTKDLVFARPYQAFDYSAR